MLADLLVVALHFDSLRDDCFLGIEYLVIKIFHLVRFLARNRLGLLRLLRADFNSDGLFLAPRQFRILHVSAIKGEFIIFGANI